MEFEEKVVETLVIEVPAGLFDVAEDGSHDALEEGMKGLWDVW